MKLRHYEYKLETQEVCVERGTRFRPRKTANQYRVVGSDNFTCEWTFDKDVAVNILRQRSVGFDEDFYTIEFDKENGIMTLDENPWPEPKIRYRILISAENNDIYYNVEESSVKQREWKRIIHTTDQAEAVRKMMIMAEHNVLDENEDHHGLLVVGDHEIIIIGKDGYSYSGKEVSEITGALVI